VVEMGVEELSRASKEVRGLQKRGIKGNLDQPGKSILRKTRQRAREDQGASGMGEKGKNEMMGACLSATDN